MLTSRGDGAIVSSLGSAGMHQSEEVKGGENAILS